MKIISLNTWGGAAGLKRFLDFVKHHADTDIFCFQEVWSHGENHIEKLKDLYAHLAYVEPNLFEKIQEILPNHEGYFLPVLFGDYGLAIFLNKSKRILNSGSQYVYKNEGWYNKEQPGDHARPLQYISVETEVGSRTIMNLHGMWQKGLTHADAPNRIEQSKRIVQFTKTLEQPFVLIGDLNILPVSQSAHILENAGMRNLINEYKITSTRTSLYDGPDAFADHAFVSSNIIVDRFEVLPGEISDHSPLLLEFR